MRRKQGSLVPLEVAILEVANKLYNNGTKEFYGFQIADKLRQQKSLLSNGTLYRALLRLERFGFLVSQWEDAINHLNCNRPRRRYYQLVNPEPQS